MYGNEIQFMKDLELKIDDLYIRAYITHEVSQIVISELKNNEKYSNSSHIQGLTFKTLVSLVNSVE